MKNTLMISAFLIAIMMFDPAAASAQTNIAVDDDGMASVTNCDSTSPAPASIQAAVNVAVNGANIYVCPGTYNEQVKISAKTVRIRGKASGNEDLILIKPSGMVANTSSLSSGVPIHAVIVAEASANILLDNLTLDGADNGINNTDCTPVLVGIFFRNSSGTASNNVIRNMKFTPANGCGGGFGVFAQTGGGPGVNSVVNLTNNSIHDYQKAGILANEAGTRITAKVNAISGDGPTPFPAQNGIQIGFGATGLLELNTVINHVWNGCTSASNCAAVATNVLVFESNNVTVRNNRLGKAQVNIYFFGNSGLIQTNSILDTDIFDGILVSGDNNDVALNNVKNSDEAAISIEGQNNKVRQNSINEAPTGILDTGTGTSIPLTGTSANNFYNVGEKIVISPTLAGRPSGAPKMAAQATRP